MAVAEKKCWTGPQHQNIPRYAPDLDKLNRYITRWITQHELQKNIITIQYLSANVQYNQ